MQWYQQQKQEQQQQQQKACLTLRIGGAQNAVGETRRSTHFSTAVWLLFSFLWYSIHFLYFHSRLYALLCYYLYSNTCAKTLPFNATMLICTTFAFHDTHFILYWASTWSRDFLFSLCCFIFLSLYFLEHKRAERTHFHAYATPQTERSMSKLNPIIAQRLLSHSLCTLNGLHCLDGGIRYLTKGTEK